MYEVLKMYGNGKTKRIRLCRLVDIDCKECEHFTQCRKGNLLRRKEDNPMGNSNGLLGAMLTSGTNQVKRINKKYYFSFAHGDEIALVKECKERRKYFILNCTGELWEKVCKKVDSKQSISRIINWWKDTSKQYEISDWSESFKLLK